MMRSTRVRALAGCLALWGLLASCEDVTNVQVIEIGTTGALFGIAYVDNDGDAELGASDDPLANATIILKVAGGSAVVEEAESDSLGIFVMDDVPVGTYDLDLSPTTLGDSLSAVAGSGNITVSLGDTTRIDFGVSYPSLTLDSVRSHPEGRLVFTSGIALNPRTPFGDGQVHINTDSSYLRLLNVERSSLGVGDSVRFLGRTALDNGYPVLTEVTPFVLIRAAAIPRPVDAGTGPAATADGGRWDAAFLRVRNAEISDTSTAGNGDFSFFLDDGSGPLEVVMRAFLQLDPSIIRPDTVVRGQQITGLLTPVQDELGNVRWKLLPRGSSDLVFEVKTADLSVTAIANPDQGSAGDTIEFRMVVRNAGPLAASGVSLADTVPDGFTYISSTASRGSYLESTGMWALDSIQVGRADTLFIRAEILPDLFGTSVNTATIVGPAKEVDPNPINNKAQVSVRLLPPSAPPRR